MTPIAVFTTRGNSGFLGFGVASVTATSAGQWTVRLAKPIENYVVILSPRTLHRSASSSTGWHRISAEEFVIFGTYDADVIALSVAVFDLDATNGA